MIRDVWLSIHPRWATAIIDGTKSVELRRRGPSLQDGSRAVIYATAPVSSVLGTAHVLMVEQLSLDDLWSTYGAHAGIDYADFLDYFEGCTYGHAIVLGQVDSFGESVDLDSLRNEFSLVPAQGWRYLEPEVTDGLSSAAA